LPTKVSKFLVKICGISRLPSVFRPGYLSGIVARVNRLSGRSDAGPAPPQVLFWRKP